MRPNHWARPSGGNAPTRDALLVKKHGVRAPRRTTVRVEIDPTYGWETAFFNCGHEASGRGSSAVGFKGPCYTCQVEKAVAMEGGAS